MTLEEAEKFIDKKQVSLEKYVHESTINCVYISLCIQILILLLLYFACRLADKYTKDANQIRAQIKMVNMVFQLLVNRSSLSTH